MSGTGPHPSDRRQSSSAFHQRRTSHRPSPWRPLRAQRPLSTLRSLRPLSSLRLLRPLSSLRSLRPLLPLAALLALLVPVRAARPGFTPQAPDTEGREPAALLVTVPASVLLPSLVVETSDRAARALHSGSFLPHDDIPVDLNHLAMEEKLQRFFSYFKLPPGQCQERLICELTSDPARFDPVGGVFLRALVPEDLLPASADPGAADSLDVDGEEVLTRLERLQLAAGTAGNCGVRYSGCPIRPEGLISDTALRLWRWSTALTNVQFSTVEL